MEKLFSMSSIKTLIHNDFFASMIYCAIRYKTEQELK